MTDHQELTLLANVWAAAYFAARGEAGWALAFNLILVVALFCETFS